MRKMKLLFCVAVLLLAPGLSAQAGHDAAGFNLPAERLYFAALRTARMRGRVSTADENGLTFRFNFGASDKMYTDIIVTVLPTSETVSSLEMNVGNSLFKTNLDETVFRSKEEAKEDARQYLTYLREDLLGHASDSNPKKCYEAPWAATTAAAFKATRPFGWVREEDKFIVDSFFFFSKEDAVNKTEISFEVFQETRSSSCVRVDAWRHRKGEAILEIALHNGWHEKDTSLFTEFFDLVRKELLPAPAALLRTRESETRDAR
jgi:hypothetical protein